MSTLPQLYEEDIHRLDDALREFIQRSDATTAMVIDKGGFLITHQGDSNSFDLTTMAALASGAYLANQTIANLVNEANFDSVYQQGETHSMLVTNIDEFCLLQVIFRAQVGVGAVKYHAGPAREAIADQLQLAQQRDPEGGLDLSVLNCADPSEFFKRKE